ncbi:Similar to Probable peptide methionine sulfoxide reductase; acc. no. Q09859 [Pyronema omphalodes CBS 100304]|uniref:peptide-methionine (S)-S-oxide reductase n=1 Tax=Pyronema omphalodes (strain CBS 100304) TaxID=1076935 RepID=U4LFY1_PYROM|nr:Similar to Probable peptide methionine sulfoxide reductase; acc. no. Q09859 [Pyronema omphalodes CBS 100304]
MVTSFLSRFIRPFSSATAPPLGAGMAVPENAQKATLAAGCFWGVEHLFRRQFAKEGLLDVQVGYIGGESDSPTYRAVCTGDTGHAEAIQVLFDPTQTSYESLLEFFYRMHDPTTPNRQGPDMGTQYRSAIFYHDDEQHKAARKITDAVNEKWYKGKVATEIVKAGKWWGAEEYHQKYLDKNPRGYECPAHFIRDFPAL